MNTFYWIAGAIGILAAAGLGYAWLNMRGKPAPTQLKPGTVLPDFEAEDEDGHPISTAALRGTPAVILFVRGNWCPFCSRQVADLTGHYRGIVAEGARLVFVTPKPLATTRRVAEFFDVDFEFWLDPDLSVASALGLVHRGGVPGMYRDTHGTDTVWPTELVVDESGTIRYAEQSRYLVDRPDPQVLLRELKKLRK